MGRIFGLLAVVIAMAAGFYVYTRQGQAISEATPGGNLQSAALLTGVKNDLLSIANAERGYMAEQGRYASLAELVSGRYITIKGERPPYHYDVETSDSSFRVTAIRSDSGSPARLWIDESMQIQTGE